MPVSALLQNAGLDPHPLGGGAGEVWSSRAAHAERGAVAPDLLARANDSAWSAAADPARAVEPALEPDVAAAEVEFRRAAE